MAFSLLAERAELLDWLGLGELGGDLLPSEDWAEESERPLARVSPVDALPLAEPEA